MLSGVTDMSKIEKFIYKDGVLLKSNLFSALDRMLSKKVTYIHGPSGFGKTTAISFWIRKNNYTENTVWLDLTKNENTQDNLLQFLTISLEKYLEMCITADVDNHGNAMDLGFGRLSKIMEEISKTKKHFFIVVDNLETLKERNLFETTLNKHTFIPSSIHFILISKTRQLTGLSELKLNDSFLEIGPSLLKFNEEEIEFYINTVHELNLDSEALNSIKCFCDGWPSILKLIILSIKETNSIKYSVNINNYYINDYLERKVFGVLDNSTRDFMLKTSILSSLNYELCSSIAEDANIHEHIDFLYKSDFLVGCKVNEGLRYNDLIVSFLRNKLFKHESLIAKKLYLSAADWCEKNSLFDDAVEYYLKAEDYSSCLSILEKYAVTFLSKGFEYDKFINLVEKLPKDQLFKSPLVVIYYSTFLALSGKLDREESLLFIKGINLDSELFKDFRSEVLTARLVNSAVRLDLDYGLSLIRNSKLPEPSVSIFSEIYNAISLEIYFFAGDFNAARSYYKKYIDCLNHNHSIFFYFVSEFIFSAMTFLSGDLYASEKLCLNNLNTLDDSNKSLNCVKYSFSLLLSYIYYELNNIEKSLYYVNEAVNITKHNINSYTDLILENSMFCCIYLCNNQLDKALISSDKMRIFTSEYKNLPALSFLHIYDAVILLDKMNKFDTAKELVLKYSSGNQSKKYFAYESLYFSKIFILYKENKLEEALILLNNMKDSIINSERISSRIQYLILLSMVNYKYGLKENALLDLKGALELGQQHYYCRIFLNHMNYIGDILKYLDIADITLYKPRSFKLPETISDNIKPKEITEFNEYKTKTDLSQRENQVLQLVADGLSNQEISEKIYVTESTVKKHINSIFTKLNVKNRAQAIKIYNNYSF